MKNETDLVGIVKAYYGQFALSEDELRRICSLWQEHRDAQEIYEDKERGLVDRSVPVPITRFPEDKMLMITIMPPESHPPKMYVAIRMDELTKGSSICMRWYWNEKDYILVFEICEESAQGAYLFSTTGMSFNIDKHPSLNTQNLYERFGWTKYMSYRMIAPLTKKNQFIFRLADATPYAVNDFVPQDEMKRLRAELTPMELTRLFMPGATEPYVI